MSATPLERVHMRRTVAEKISMWGTLHVNRLTREIHGWTVDTWTERGVTPNLRPRLHFVPKEDGKIYKIHLSGSFATIQNDGEDTEIEPHRAAFIKATIALWEQEWLEEEATKLGSIAVVPKPLPDVKPGGVSPSDHRKVK